MLGVFFSRFIIQCLNAQLSTSVTLKLVFRIQMDCLMNSRQVLKTIIATNKCGTHWLLVCDKMKRQTGRKVIKVIGGR